MSMGSEAGVVLDSSLFDHISFVCHSAYLDISWIPFPSSLSISDHRIPLYKKIIVSCTGALSLLESREY